MWPGQVTQVAFVHLFHFLVVEIWSSHGTGFHVVGFSLLGIGGIGRFSANCSIFLIFTSLSALLNIGAHAGRRGFLGSQAL